MKLPNLGKIVTWIVEAIAGKAARDLTNDTDDPAPLTRRSVELEWNQRHAGPRQRRNEIPPPKGRPN